MKQFIKFTVLAILMINLTSCYEFRREQHLLDSENDGKAILLQAENEKKAMIEEAKAELESAQLRKETRILNAQADAQAEIERAKGVAEANRIIGESLQGNDNYLEYLKIITLESLDEGDRVYIPTEALLPITEANK